MQARFTAPPLRLVAEPFQGGYVTRPAAFRSMAWVVLRSLLLIAVATTLILVLLPLTLDAVAVRSITLT